MAGQFLEILCFLCLTWVWGSFNYIIVAAASKNDIDQIQAWCRTTLCLSLEVLFGYSRSASCTCL